MQNAPHLARGCNNCDSAWWYEDENSIGIYLYSKENGGMGMNCRIDRIAIEGWLKRVARLAASKKRKGGK